MSFPIPTTTPSAPPGTPPRPSPIPPSPNSLPDHKVHINPHNPEAPKDLRSIVFTPDLDTSAIVIQSLLDPNKSLAGIALENKTTIEALSTWMADPDVAIRIFNMKRAAAVQHSLAATFQLKHATNALVIILKEFADSACHAAGIQQGRGASPSEHIRRDRETARKASHLLARLANFDQSIRPPRSPLPRPGGGGAERSKAEGARPAHSQPRTNLDAAPTLADAESHTQLLSEITDLLAHLGTPPTAPKADQPAHDASRAPLLTHHHPTPRSPSPLLTHHHLTPHHASTPQPDTPHSHPRGGTSPPPILSPPPRTRPP